MTASTSADCRDAPSVLVAEDDAASGEFFRLALEQFGCHVSVRTHGREALDLARRRHFDLLILDRNLPGPGAESILAELRADQQAASHGTPALATSAELDEATRTDLSRHGFVEVLAKPLALATLHAGISEALPVYRATPPLLDDAAALEQSGSAQSLAALRRLFTDELQAFLDDLSQPHQVPAAGSLSDRLHRLMASCGFCGASALANTAQALKRTLDDGLVPAPEEMQRLRRTISDTLDALTGNHGS